MVDEVWNIEDLKAFLVDAPGSRLLFITRNGGIARAVTERDYAADLLDDDKPGICTFLMSDKSD